MPFELLIQGALSGFAIAAPVGPINVLCIRRTLVDGFGLGLASGLGAAVADTLFGAVAAFGVASVMAFLARWEGILCLFGGVVLVLLGCRGLFSRPPADDGRIGGVGFAGAFASTFGMTIANPMTVLSFLAVFAAIGIGAPGLGAATVLVVGVFLGSAAWWLGLSGVVSAIRHTLSEAALSWIHRSASFAILAFGIWALVRSAQILWV
ncbi:MAG: LysE family translocator [Alphaproteobacteria bacterium]|nr:LysE family translocator [Alphaproteobacteria bacterium]